MTVPATAAIYSSRIACSWARHETPSPVTFNSSNFSMCMSLVISKLSYDQSSALKSSSMYCLRSVGEMKLPYSPLSATLMMMMIPWPFCFCGWGDYTTVSRREAANAAPRLCNSENLCAALLARELNEVQTSVDASQVQGLEKVDAQNGDARIVQEIEHSIWVTFINLGGACPEPYGRSWRIVQPRCTVVILESCVYDFHPVVRRQTTPPYLRMWRES